MKPRERVSHVHFSGVCGTAMGNAAIGLKKKGFTVTGSDGHVYPPMSDTLRAHGIAIGPFSADAALAADLVVIGNAIPRGNPEAEAVLNHRHPFCSLPELVRDFFLEDRKLILVTGTHGKTSTSAMIAHLLAHAGMRPAYLIGGVPVGWPSGFDWHESAEWMVLEGDEYDTAFFDKTAKFLKFSPDVLVVNALEFDHGDIYRDLVDLRRAFQFLLRRTPGNARVFARGDDPEVAGLAAHCRSQWETFGLSRDNQHAVTSLSPDADCQVQVEARMAGRPFTWTWRLPGRHNACNGLAAALAATAAGLDPDTIAEGLGSFPGVMRRFQLRSQVGETRIVEDFAHHPTAVRETIDACRQIYPGRRVIACFEPATNTLRAGMLWDELMASLETADQSILLPMPRTKRHAAHGRTDLRTRAERVCVMKPGESIVPYLDDMVRAGDVLLFMSNADFQGILDEALHWLEEQKHG